MNVPGANTPYAREFGTLGNSIAGAGSDLLRGSLDIKQTMNTAEAMDAANSAYSSDKTESAQKITELTLASPDGYMHSDYANPTEENIVQNPDGSRRTRSQEFYDWSNERFQDQQTKMPNELASEMYRGQALRHFSDSYAVVQNDTQQAKFSFWKQRSLFDAKDKGGDPNFTPQLLDKQVSMVNPVTGRSVMMPVSQDVDARNFYGNYQDMVGQGMDQVANRVMDAKENAALTRTKGQIMTEEAARMINNNLREEKKTNGPLRVDQVLRAIDFYRGEDPDSQQRRAEGRPIFSELMDPDKREMRIKEALSLLPQAKVTDNENLKHELTGYNDWLQRGNYSQDRDDQMSLKILQYGSQPGHEAEAAIMFATKEGSHQIGMRGGPSTDGLSEQRILNTYNQGAEAAKQKTLEFIYGIKRVTGYDVPPETISKAIGAVDDISTQRINSIREKKKSDLVAFAQSADPDYNNSSVVSSGVKAGSIDWGNGLKAATESLPVLEQFVREMDTKGKGDWKDQGINAREVFSLTQSKLIGDQLKGLDKNRMMSEEQAGKFIQQMGTAKYNILPRMLSQIEKDGNLPGTAPILALHAYDGDTAAMTEVMKDFRGDPRTKADFKENLLNYPGKTELQMMAAASKVTKDFSTGIAQLHPGSQQSEDTSSAIRDFVAVGAMKLFNESPSRDFDSCAQEAYHRLIGSHISIDSVHNSSWFSSSVGDKDSLYILPDRIRGNLISDDDRTNIRTNLRSRLNPDAMKTAGVSLPPGIGILGDKFHPMASRNSKPVYDMGKDGFFVWYTNGLSGADHSVNSQLQKNGQPWFIPSSDVMKKPPEGTPLIQRIQKFMGGSGVPDRYNGYR